MDPHDLLKNCLITLSICVCVFVFNCASTYPVFPGYYQIINYHAPPMRARNLGSYRRLPGLSLLERLSCPSLKSAFIAFLPSSHETNLPLLGRLFSPLLFSRTHQSLNLLAPYGLVPNADDPASTTSPRKDKGLASMGHNGTQFSGRCQFVLRHGSTMTYAQARKWKSI